MKQTKTDSPIGVLYITTEGDSLCGISVERNEELPLTEPQNRVEKAAVSQLREYFAGERKEFCLSLAPRGTDFQKRVWAELQKIGWGRTATYGDIARRCGCTGGARAVGGACNKNPILIVVPCHRVLGAGGRLTGFACGVDKKEALLALENTIFGL